MILENQELAETLNSIFNEIDTHNNNICLRKNKIILRDAVYYRFMYSKNNTTKEAITSSLNFDNNNNIHRTSYYRKENNITLELYKNILDKIKEKYNKIITGNNLEILNDKTILAVDGTFNNTNINKLDNTLETSLSMGYYDVTKDIPIDLEFIGAGKKNTEIENLNNYLKEKNLKNTILVNDRAYFKYELFKNLNDNNLNFVTRIKENSYLINDNGKPKKYKNSNLIEQFKNTFRVIECEYYKEKILKTKKNKEINIKQKLKYYLLTNLNDKEKYTDEVIKNIYNSRWKVEIFFKLLKSNFKFSYLAEKKEEHYKKLIIIELIMIYLCKIFKYYFLKSKDKTKVITKRKNKGKAIVSLNVNESNIITGLYEKLLQKIIYSKLNEKDIENFTKSYIKVTQNEKDRQFPRVCKCPFKKWYIKAYHEIYKYSKIKDAIDNNSIEKLNKNLKLLVKDIKIEIT